MLQRTCLFMSLLGTIVCQANEAAKAEVVIVVLGMAQDAGRPHIGCRKSCCQDAWQHSELRRYPTCLAIVDRASSQRWIIECTPDFAWQLELLNELAPPSHVNRAGLDGIVLTHAHIGHYAGLMLLGREALGADGVPVYAMPRMRSFLTSNGPWSQLVASENIKLRPMHENETLELNNRIRIEPFRVPHRDEYSETVGFIMAGPKRTALFIPDIDKWERWDTRIEELIKETDFALLDGTFYSGEELPHRDMSEIPHPFMVESLERFKTLDAADRQKIHFIHLNHSNPAHDADAAESQRVRSAGMHVARRGLKFEL